MEQFSEEFKKIKGKIIPPLEPIVNNIIAIFNVKVKPNKTRTRYFNIVKIKPTYKVELINKTNLVNKNNPKNIYHVWNYVVDPVRLVTPIKEAAITAATLVIDNNNLYLIKTKQTFLNHVKTQRILRPCYYNFKLTALTIIAFKICSNQDGTFYINNGDLYYIKKL
jgi:hypothetical protein